MRDFACVLSLASGFAAPVIAAAEAPGGGAAEPRPAVTRDFGFLSGKSLIRHRRLKEIMAGSDEWAEFETGYEWWNLLDGAANADRSFGEVNGKFFEGVSLRTYDEGTGEWTIYWMDTGNPTLREQVRGRFESGVGTFYGAETNRGVTYRMRFLWQVVSDTTARWEQAYQDPASGRWETNWTMDFYAGDAAQRCESR